MKLLDAYRKRHFHVLQVDLSDAANLSARCTSFTVKGDRMDKASETSSKPFRECINELPKNAAVLLQVIGDLVLTRQAQGPDESLFGELDKEEFYVQSNSSAGGISLQSACRKEAVDPMVHLIIQSGKYVLDLSLGPQSYVSLGSQIEEGELVFGHLLFSFRDHKLDRITEVFNRDKSTVSNATIIIDGCAYDSLQLASLAFCMNYLMCGHWDLQLLDDQERQWRFHRQFRMLGLGALAFLFVILLVNYLLFSEFQNKLQELKSNGEDRLEEVNEIELLSAQLEEYRLLSADQHFRPQESFSFYLDELALKRTNGLWFNTLNIHPTPERVERGKALVPDKGLILLEGEANDPVKFNLFVTNLKKESWVRDVEILHYERDQEQPVATFKIAILK